MPSQHEIFESTHRDINAAVTVLAPCAVLTELEFGRYQKTLRRCELTGTASTAPAPGQHANAPPLPAKDVYFCRRGYNPGRSRFVTLSADQTVFARVPRAPPAILAVLAATEDSRAELEQHAL